MTNSYLQMMTPAQCSTAYNTAKDKSGMGPDAFDTEVSRLLANRLAADHVNAKPWHYVAIARALSQMNLKAA